MSSGRKADKTEVEQLIKSVDKNGDGKINKQELLTIFKQVASKWWFSYFITFILINEKANLKAIVFNIILSRVLWHKSVKTKFTSAKMTGINL